MLHNHTQTLYNYIRRAGCPDRYPFILTRAVVTGGFAGALAAAAPQSVLDLVEETVAEVGAGGLARTVGWHDTVFADAQGEEVIRSCFYHFHHLLTKRLAVSEVVSGLVVILNNSNDLVLPLHTNESVN